MRKNVILNTNPKRKLCVPKAGASLVVLIAAAVCAAISGCNIIGPAFVLVHGPPRVPAEFELDKDRVTTVLVDDQNAILPRRQYRLLVSKEIEAHLLDKKKLTVDMIDSQAVLASVNREKPDERRSIPQIGRDVGAEVVIWVTFAEFSLTPDGSSLRPFFRARIKVVDAVEGKVIWPEVPSGYLLEAPMDTKVMSMPDSYSERAQLERQLAEHAGTAIAELFYEVEKTFSARDGN